MSLWLTGCVSGGEGDTAAATATLETPSAPVIGAQTNPLQTGGTVKCAASFASKDSLGNSATAVVRLYNSKVPGTARATQTDSSGHVEMSYPLKTLSAASNVLADADVRGDAFYCTVALSAGSLTTATVQSVNFAVEDTRPTLPVASGGSQTQALARFGASIAAVQLSAEDADGDVISYTATSNTCGDSITLDSSTGLVSGMVPNANSASSNTQCGLVIHASSGSTTSEYPVNLSFEITNNLPTLTCSNAYQTLSSGAAPGASINCSGSDVDSGTVFAYSLTNCASLSINASTGAVTGTMPAIGCSATVTVSDGAYAASTPVNLKLGFLTIPQGLNGFSNLPSNTVYGIHVDGATIYAATDRGLGKSTDGGSIWSALVAANGIGSDYVFDVTGSGSDIYLASEYGFAASHDSGASWSTLDNVDDVYFMQGRSIEVIGSTLLYDGEVGPPARSTDKGATWSNLNISLAAVNDFFVDSANSKVYASTYTSYIANSGGVQVSSDTGATWNVLGASTSLQTEAVVAVAASGGTVYVALNPNGGNAGGVAYSADNGASWTLKHTLSSTSNYAYDIYVETGVIYLATSDSLLTSNNNGDTWTAYAGLAATWELLAVGSQLWAATAGYGVMKAPFSNLSATTQYKHNLVLPAGAIAVDSSRIYASSTYSTDSGASWNFWGGGYSASSVVDIYLSGFGAIDMAGYNGLSVSTNDGSSWTRYTTIHGLPRNDLNAVTLHNSSTYVVASAAGVSLSSTPATSWSTKTTTDGLGSNSVNDVASDGTRIYAATDNGVSISEDNGASWSNKTTANGLAYNVVNAVVASGGKVYAGTGDGLSISSDNGATWTTYRDGLPGAGIKSVQTVALDGSVIYLGTTRGLAISADGGSTWVTYAERDGVSDDWIRSVAVRNGTIYVQSYYAGLAKSQ